MKKTSLILMVIFAVAILFTSCKDKNEINADIVPSKFKVDIPSSISETSTNKNDDVLNGGQIYEHLRTFIAVGESSADIVQGIMGAIREYELDQAMSFSYTSEEDGRTKEIVIVENSTFEGQNWEYQLTTTDEDGGKGLQVFWNNNPVKGISILNPYNINRSETSDWSDENTMYRVDYSEAGTAYDAEMTVYISGLKLPETVTEENKYAMETLKMFAGKKGDIVDVFGNSNHPNASFLEGTDSGFNWAFAASGNDVSNIAVAEVGLPPSNLNEDSRAVILETYSINNVFTQIITDLGIYTDEQIQAYLAQTQAPGYFSSGGFLNAGTSPGDTYNEIETSMEALTPYNPVSVSNLIISFKDDDAL